LLVRAGYLELAAPDLEAALAGLAGQPVVVVPLLLGAGYHVKVDIRARVPAGIPVAAPLGPHPRLVRVVADRLRAAGRGPGAPGGRVVLAGAGSADAEAVLATRHTARLLELATGSPVQAAFAAAADPGVPAAVAALRARHPGRRVAVAPYLLAPGRFADTVA